MKDVPQTEEELNQLRRDVQEMICFMGDLFLRMKP